MLVTFGRISEGPAKSYQHEMTVFLTKIGDKAAVDRRMKLDETNRGNLLWRTRFVTDLTLLGDARNDGGKAVSFHRLTRRPPFGRIGPTGAA
jgi:hypothetical protein